MPETARGAEQQSNRPKPARFHARQHTQSARGPTGLGASSLGVLAWLSISASNWIW
jgi:hypothetical protein